MCFLISSLTAIQGKTRTLEWRRKQLLQLLALLKENRAEVNSSNSKIPLYVTSIANMPRPRFVRHRSL